MTQHLPSAVPSPRTSQRLWLVMPAFAAVAVAAAVLSPPESDAARPPVQIDAPVHHAMLLTPSPRPGEGERPAHPDDTPPSY